MVQFEEQLGGSSREHALQFAEKKAKEIIQRYDRDADGVISLSEFITIALDTPRLFGTLTNLRHLFAEFDTDKDGQLDEAELKSMLTQLNEELGGFPKDVTSTSLDQVAVAIIAEADADKDGKISLDEFLRFSRRSERCPPSPSLRSLFILF